MKSKKEFTEQASSVAENAYTSGWIAGIKHVQDKSAMDLLERFTEVYGEVPLRGAMIEPGIKLWHDFYEFSGEHMILTDEGWEPGEARRAYIDDHGPEAILDEVNAP